MYMKQRLEPLPGDDEIFEFDVHPIAGSEVFACTALSFAFVNIKPVLSGRELPLLRWLLIKYCACRRTRVPASSRQTHL